MGRSCLTFTMIVAIMYQSSCRTIALKYQTTAKIRSSYYTVSSHTTLRTDRLFWACWSTILIYGGACSYYLVLPDGDDKELAEFDLTQKLAERLPNAMIYISRNGDVSRLLFEEFDTEIQLKKIKQPMNTKFIDIYDIKIPEQRSFWALTFGMLIISITVIGAVASPLTLFLFGPFFGVGGIGLLINAIDDRLTIQDLE